MGVDIICWKECAAQRAFGVKGFLAKVKLVAYKAAAERAAPDRLDHLKIRLRTGDESKQTMTYREICKELDDASQAAPDCAECLLSGGRQEMCYQYISYPIDETFEALLFDYFVEEAPMAGSPCNQIYRDVISSLPREGLPWHTRRGSETGSDLAMLPQPLLHRFDTPIHGHDYLDSAQILAALFRTLDSAAEIMAYGVFWNQFMTFMQRQEPAFDEDSPNLKEVTELADFFKIAMAHSVAGDCSVLVFS